MCGVFLLPTSLSSMCFRFVLILLRIYSFGTESLGCTTIGTCFSSAGISSSFSSCKEDNKVCATTIQQLCHQKADIYFTHNRFLIKRCPSIFCCFFFINFFGRYRIKKFFHTLIFIIRRFIIIVFGKEVIAHNNRNGFKNIIFMLYSFQYYYHYRLMQSLLHLCK